MSMYVAGRGDVGNSATYLYINDELISLAKVAVIVRGHFVLVWFLVRCSASMTWSDVLFGIH